jgi:hypothetical protein
LERGISCSFVERFEFSKETKKAGHLRDYAGIAAWMGFGIAKQIYFRFAPADFAPSAEKSSGKCF